MSMHIQVTWWREGACLYLFLVIVCRVFVCPSVLAGQIWWRSRHMDQTFCLSACFKVHLMVVDLDRTDQPRQAGPIPSVNGPDFIWKIWCMLSQWRQLESSDFRLVSLHARRCTVWRGYCFKGVLETCNHAEIIKSGVLSGLCTFDDSAHGPGRGAFRQENRFSPWFMISNDV